MKLLSDHYWKRWRNELRNVHTRNGENDTNINFGEVVINEQLK